VCRSVCHTSEPCKNGCTDQDAVWVEELGEPKEPCIIWGSRSPWEMLFGLWARMGPRNHVLDGGPALVTDVAMATNFGTKIAINWLCVNDSDYGN